MTVKKNVKYRLIPCAAIEYKIRYLLPNKVSLYHLAVLPGNTKIVLHIGNTCTSVVSEYRVYRTRHSLENEIEEVERKEMKEMARMRFLYTGEAKHRSKLGYGHSLN